MKKKRMEWIDISKFIAITIMILGHMGMPAGLSDLIHIFHMPVFFILSGVCYKPEKYNKFYDFVISRAKGLLVPYFVWGGVMYCIWYVIPRFKAMGIYLSPWDFLGELLTFDAKIPLFGGFGVIQWFFTSLFFAEILAWFIIKISLLFQTKVLQIGIRVACCMFLMFCSNIAVTIFSENPLGVISSLFGAVMYVTGFSIQQIDIMFNEKHRNWHFLITLLSSVFLILVWRINGSTNMRMAQYGNIILYYIGALSGSVLIICISGYATLLLSQCFIYKIFLYLGRNTAIILCFNRLIQWSIIFYLNGLFGYTLGDASFGYIKMIGIEILDMIVELVSFIPIIYLVNKYLPFTLGRAKKIK